MNAPYSFNFKYDPILENPFRSEIDYNREIDERVRQLQLMKDKYNSTVKQTTQSESLWNKIDNEMFWCIMKDIHEELRGKHFDEVYATYQVDNMYHTDNKGNKITSPMFTPIDVRKLYDKKFKSINSNITFWDVYVALNAQYHDNIELYKEWFGEDNIENIKDKIIESAIVNWFEDEDAGIEKVWNYFRAI